MAAEDEFADIDELLDGDEALGLGLPGAGKAGLRKSDHSPYSKLALPSASILLTMATSSVWEA